MIPAHDVLRCQRCHNPTANRGGTCAACLGRVPTEPVKHGHVARVRMVGEVVEPAAKPQPTTVDAGTREKLEVLAARAALGLELHHERDPKCDLRRVGPLEVRVVETPRFQFSESA